MDKLKINQYKSTFDGIVHYIENEQQEQVEVWFARELQTILGYARWENFVVAINRAVDSCKTQQINVDDHFREVTKMITIGKGGQREVEDYMLTRFACYLIAQNGDPQKEEIAFAQSYFAIQTRKIELLEARLNLKSRLETRDKLRAAEKQLSQNIYERGVDDKGFGRIRSKGDTALFGGHTTEDMKQRLGIKSTRPLADFLPTLTIAAKNLATEMTNYNVSEKDLQGESPITEVAQFRRTPPFHFPHRRPILRANVLAVVKPCLLLCCAFFICAASLAQPDSNLILTPERLGMKDIVLYNQDVRVPEASAATRSLERVKNLPYTVWTIHSEEIIRNGYVTLADVLRHAPGVRVSQPGNALESELFLLRGLSGNQYVKILVNDVPLKPSIAPGMPIGAQLPIRQAERIELVYGPNGALFGNEACAGVVNIILKETERPIFTQADLSFGNFSYNSLDLMFGGKLGKDKNILRFSLYGSSTVRGITDVYGDQSLYDANKYLPLGLDTNLYDLNPNFRNQTDGGSIPKLSPVSHESRLFGAHLSYKWISFTYHRMSRLEHTALGLNPLAISWSNPSNRVDERIESFVLSFNNERRNRRTFNTLSLLRYRIDPSTTSNYVFDRLSSATYYAWRPGTNNNDSLQQARIRQTNQIFASDERYTVANGLDARYEWRTNILFGHSVFLDAGGQANLGGGVPANAYAEVPGEVDAFGGTPLNMPIGPVPIFADGDLDVSAFVQVEYRRRRFRLIGAVAANVALPKRNETILSPRFAALFKLDSAIHLYANYSKGFRRPSQYARANSFLIGKNYQNFIIYQGEDPANLFKPEIVHAWETGIRFDNEKGSSADLSAFYQTVDNLLRPGYFNPDYSSDFLYYGYRNTPGKAQQLWGLQGRLVMEGRNFITLSTGRKKTNVSGKTTFYFQYTRGKEWLEPGAAPTGDVFNQPRWMFQFRTELRAGRLILIFNSNRQNSALGKSILYRERLERSTVRDRYPKFRTWDFMGRFYLSNHFVLYVQSINLFNASNYGLDATGTADDLLYNPQPGRVMKFGVNYNMN